MTLFELSDRYEYSAALLRRRIVQLDLIRGRTPDRDARAMLDERQRVLRGMWREMRELTRLTRRYYDGNRGRDRRHLQGVSAGTENAFQTGAACV